MTDKSVAEHRIEFPSELREGDRIVQLAGRRLHQPYVVTRRRAAIEPGSTVYAVRVEREGEQAHGLVWHLYDREIADVIVERRIE